MNADNGTSEVKIHAIGSPYQISSAALYEYFHCIRLYACGERINKLEHEIPIIRMNLSEQAIIFRTARHIKFKSFWSKYF